LLQRTTVHPEDMSKKNFIGGIGPVAQRELREGARRPFNYWLRVGAGAAGLLLVVYVTQIQAREVKESEMGLFLFPRLHFLLMGLICLMVPCMTADCIARERREGTLGLLFLTPLTAGGIVAGKGLAQALRALTLWVSMSPVLTIPFVMGGVGWAEASAALALEFSALVICLAAGLLASTLLKGRGAALLLALFLGGILVALFCWLAVLLFLAQNPLAGPLANGLNINSRVGFNILLSGLPLDSSRDILVLAPVLPGIDIYPDEYLWFMSMAVPAPTVVAAASHLWSLILWASPIPALLLFVLVLRFAAWSMARSWQDKIPSPRQESLVRTYCTPIFQRWFARRSGRMLDRNPIAWLQQYSWKARAGKWFLCLAFVVAATVLVCGNRYNYYDFGAITVLLLFLAVAAGMTFAGINSFAEEKRSGALELILVTPVSVNQIIFGRVLGVWRQFFPAALMLALFDAACLWVRGDLKLGLLSAPGFVEFPPDFFTERLLLVCGFITLPVFALYFTLRVRNSIVAAGLTWTALLLPFLLVMPLLGFVWHRQQVLRFDGFWRRQPESYFQFQRIPFDWLAVDWSLVNLAFAVAAFFLLRRALSRRLFSFQK
jgi:ABC-type Na+ efflux pump permease subunit